ncbi:MAG: winged helix-turn-helix domain-containing protein, partial [Phycisphaerae bacterium]
GDTAAEGDAKAAKKAKVHAWRKDVAAKTQSDPEKRRKQNEKERRAKAAAKQGRKAKPKSKAKRESLLDLAAEVLAEAKEPMSAKAIVEKVLASGRWQTKGKTPDATLYSAIIREISKKGDDARFEKVERGTFQLAK